MERSRIMWQHWHSDSEKRGQTTIDFTVGIVLFISVMGGVFLLLPTVFEPFSTSTTAESIVADQIATQLTTELLQGSDPASLNAVCTAAFFGQNASLDSECPFTADDSLKTITGLDSTTDTAISIHDTGESPDDSATTTVDGVTYELNRDTRDTGKENIAVATRTVELNGDTYRLTVEVW